jgi:hypothetical protein
LQRNCLTQPKTDYSQEALLWIYSQNALAKPHSFVDVK